MTERLETRRTPRGVVHFRVDAQAWLRAAGFLDGTAGAGRPDRRVFHQTRLRENAIWAEGPGGGPAFEKRTRVVTLSMLQKMWRKEGRAKAPLIHEWEMLWRVRGCGIRVPLPVAAGEVRGAILPRSDFLVTERLAGISLLDAIDGLLSRSVGDQHRIAVAAGRGVAALHAADIGFPTLFAKHLYLDEGPGGRCDVGFLDLAAAGIEPRLPRASRARDLGALVASLPFRVRRPLLARFLRAYLETAGGWPAREAWSAIANAARFHLLLRRFRKSLAPRPVGAITAAGSPVPGGGRRERERTATFDLLRRFGVPLLDGAPPIDLGDDHGDLLQTLLRRTLQAGVLPVGPVLAFLRTTQDGELAWDTSAPLMAPRRARAAPAWWRLLLLRREIARSGMSPAARAPLLDWLGRAAVPAFLLRG